MFCCVRYWPYVQLCVKYLTNLICFDILHVNILFDVSCPTARAYAHYSKRMGVHMSLMKRMLGAAMFAMVSAGAAQAAVITFEGLDGPAFNRQAFNEAGYNVAFIDPGATAPPNTVLIGRFIDGSNPATCAPSICPTDNPTTYLDLFNTGFVDITANTPGATFRFSSLDASLLGMLAGDDVLFPAALQVFGFRSSDDDDPLVIQFNIPNALDFQTFNVLDADNGAAFAQTDFVEIAIAGFACNAVGQCFGLDGTPGEIGLDNIVLSDLPPPVNQVPEPATLSLLAFGLMGLGARMRRRG